MNNNKIKYKKQPILLPYRSGGKLLRKNSDWEADLHRNIIAETEDAIHSHFQTNQSFPEVLTSSIDQILLRRKKEHLLQEYGVEVEIKVQKFRPSPDQREIITQMLTNELAGSVENLHLGFPGTQRIPVYTSQGQLPESGA